MVKTHGLIGAAIFLSIGMTACSQNSDVPEHAQSREDVETIIRAYLLENPEIILEAMDVLAEREKDQVAKAISSDPRDVSIGPADAEVTIVEYFDYRCTYCKRSVDWVMNLTEEHEGRVRVVFKELPILSAQSRQAALAALAAHKQDKYLEMHQALMESSKLDDESINKIAADLGLNVTKLNKDMESAEILDQISDIRAEATKYGADATPSFFVNGELIQGFDVRRLEALINDLLN